MQGPTRVPRTRISTLLADPAVNTDLRVAGWVRTRRSGKKVSFVELNDGSTLDNLQLVIDHGMISDEVLKQVTTGAALIADGLLVQSQGKEQAVELQVRTLDLTGPADAESYPLQKKAHTLEFFRDQAHLRPRTNTFAAVLRIRHGLAFAVHEFFHKRGFFHLHAPILTGSDAEGSGEMFQVTTLKQSAVPMTSAGEVDYAQDFFKRKTHLTVSGQLEAELVALGLGEVYTFGPTFRAENSNTTRHLAEFWMIEPEMAFYDIADNMALAEEFLKHLVRVALDNHANDLAFLEKTYDQGLTAKLRAVLETPFVRLDYTEAVDILQASGKPFEFAVQWGIDLQSEHERYLVEEHFQKPVIVTNYPKQIKAFYMRVNEDGKTVRAMDVLVPGIGEIIGGSQREERYDVLLGRMKELGLPEENYWWYLDTRRFGSAPHSGFGMGFERLLQFVTGMTNIRDVIPFPRYPGSCEF
jgi:asparaginyl-tRNA synthetase